MNRKGVSILEILIASLILAAVVAGLANVFLSGKRHLAHDGLKTQALKAAMAELSRMQLEVRQDQWGNNCLSAQTSCPASINLGGRDYDLFWTTEDFEGMRRVTVRVHWDEPSP